MISREKVMGVAFSCVLVILAYMIRHTLIEVETQTEVNCTGKGEESVCSITNVCYQRGQRHLLYGRSFGYYRENPVLAYIMSPRHFPQAAIHLLAVTKMPLPFQSANHKSFDSQPANQEPSDYQPANHESSDYQPANHESSNFQSINQKPTASPLVSLLMVRFKPDNIMHVLHDDALPIFAVLKKMYPDGSIPFPVQLVFADEYGVMPHDEMYAGLVQFGLVYSADHLCFDELIVGFDKSTLWYQYGFEYPQGPVPHNNTSLNQLITSYVEDTQLATNRKKSNQITLFNRRDTRIMLNVDELVIRLSREFSASVKVVDLESHTLLEVIEAVSRSSVVIGMHGALFATMMWMPNEAVVMELFPYAVNPDNYTPYRTLANILRLKYLSWVNTDRDNTVGHDDYPREYGGLQHLPLSVQSNIVSETEVGPHLCCDDPSWLYHIYQDTEVDVEAVIRMLRRVVV